MKKPTITSLVITISLGLALALAIGFSAQSQSTKPAEMNMKMEGKMTKSCQEMMEQKQKMMADMKTQNDQLTDEVTKMNSAPESQKLGLMAAVVTHMVEQRTAMNARMEKMQEAMMKHMTEHMQMGQDSMKQCPMMMGMMGMN